jgi:hypothetical protein
MRLKDCEPVTHPWMSIQFFAREGGDSDNLLTTVLDCLREATRRDSAGRDSPRSKL